MENKVDSIGIIPAAGMGTRMGGKIPKALLQPRGGKKNLIQIAAEKLEDIVEFTIAIVSPRIVEHENWIDLAQTRLVFQDKPLGMGDAVFRATGQILYADLVIVVWADQYGISKQTIAHGKELFREMEKPAFLIPSIAVKTPYVEYLWENDKLIKVKQSREGDFISDQGITDVGCFILSGGKTLIDAWGSYLLKSQTGNKTKEVNFIPFLAYLSEIGWHGATSPAIDTDRLNLNTAEDLHRINEDPND
jgi:bifunctional UDP-N-acetylglucosamine pyrophosphorylase/glucosamine-1-phosphate N-acetyltransferase